MQLSEEISEEQVFHYMSTKTTKRELPSQKEGEPRNARRKQKLRSPTAVQVVYKLDDELLM